MTKEIEVGSEVQILDMDPCLRNDGDYEVGQICLVKDITEVYGRAKKYTVWTEDRSGYWFFVEPQLKLVS